MLTESGIAFTISSTIGAGARPVTRPTRSVTALPMSEPIHMRAKPITAHRTNVRARGSSLQNGMGGMPLQMRNAAGSETA